MKEQAIEVTEEHAWSRQGTQRSGLALVRKPMGTAGVQGAVREATTGSVVAVVPVMAKPQIRLLPRVWAVAEEQAPEAPVTQAENAQEQRTAANERGELAFYRKYTEGMLRRYVRLSMSTGRVPSLLGRELFRGNVTSYRVTNFEDVVVFCYDMEKLLGRLRPGDQRLIKRIGMQEYTQGETAAMLRMSLRQCLRAYGQALDRLTEMLLEARMLEPLGSCQ